MKWALSVIFTTLLASLALGGELAVTFDPPQKIEALSAGMKDGEFFAGTVGTVGEKEFSKVAMVRLSKSGPKAMRSETSSSFAALALDKSVVVQSLVFTWKQDVVTGYLQSKDETFRIDFEKGGSKGVVTKVDAKDVPKWDSFPQFRIPESEGPVFIKAKEPVR